MGEEPSLPPAKEYNTLGPLAACAKIARGSANAKLIAISNATRGALMLKRIARPPTLWDVNVKRAHSPIGTGSIVQAQACGQCAENCIFPTSSSATFHSN